ncbi:hypothetical protein AKJ09_07282 [Labilithrix luteola]|uniref:Lipoprotein n=1 Tax=Labilithrix luteola TaxID=1391654 RepID=A0A0K1Q4E9_9BACT|nr:hypothetical protein AKJ09_07282 [Labilithrix luteola]
MCALLSVASLIACGGPAADVPPSSSPAAPSSTVEVTAPSSSASVAEPVADAGVEAARPSSKPEPSAVAETEQKLAIGRTAPRHHAKVLDGAPRPSKLAPGNYMCRIDAMYKLRPCTVTRDERGFTWLETPDSLLGLKGVIYDEGGGLVFDGTTAEERPFGCFSCQEHCTTDPASCACVELLPDASRECLARPIVARLTKKGSSWVGSLPYKTYYNHYEGEGAARHVTSWDTKDHTFLVEVAPAPAAKKPARP